MMKDNPEMHTHDLQQDNRSRRADPMLGSMAGNAAQREPKAVIMMQRIDRFESVISRLCSLRDRIQNGDNVPTGVDDKVQENPLPTVATVLNEGPEILQIQYNKMNDLIEQIESELF